MKILLIFTGGTIGSSVSGDWISPDASAKNRLIEMYLEKTQSENLFDVISPYTILSENLAADRLNTLIRCVNENIEKRLYSGIIVLHGTDTLQYTAAALSLSLGSSSVPVVLASSNYPLEDSRANGLSNFAAAVDFIKEGLIGGVFVSYKNGKSRVNIFPAERLLTHSEMSDEVNALGGAFAYWENGKIIKNPIYKRFEQAEPLGVFEFSASSGILVITAVPGDNYSYDISGVKAVILRPFHSGTLNTENKFFRDFCKKAKNSGVPVYLPNAPSGVAYESAKYYHDLGIINLPDEPFAYTYMKVWAKNSIDN